MPLPTFSANSVKGRVAETIIQELFLAHDYNVCHYGMERSIPGIAQLTRKTYGAVKQQVRTMPDFVVQDLFTAIASPRRRSSARRDLPGGDQDAAKGDRHAPLRAARDHGRILRPRFPALHEVTPTLLRSFCGQSPPTLLRSFGGQRTSPVRPCPSRAADRAPRCAGQAHRRGTCGWRR